MTYLVRRSEYAVSVWAEEVLAPVHLSVVTAVRLVELDAAPVAVAEVGAPVVPQHAALDARDLETEICNLDWRSNVNLAGQELLLEGLSKCQQNEGVRGHQLIFKRWHCKLGLVYCPLSFLDRHASVISTERDTLEGSACLCLSEKT